ncbi:DUF5959 family protein [Streptomyces virginiae]
MSCAATHAGGRREGYAGDLINLSDGDNSFRVRVRGRRSPGLPQLHDQLDAEVLVTRPGSNPTTKSTTVSPSASRTWACRASPSSFPSAWSKDGSTSREAFLTSPRVRRTDVLVARGR